MDRLLVACAVLSAAGLVVLGVIAVAYEPKPLPIQRLAQYEGQRVCVDATLAHLRPTVGESRRILLVQGNASLPGRVRFSWEAVAGDHVRACGDLGRESGALLLDVERPSDARILQRWDEEVVNLALVADRPWAHVDRRLATVGIPIVDGRTTFLEDRTSSARLRLARADEVPSGSLQRIEGVLAFDADESRFALYVEAHRGVDA